MSTKQRASVLQQFVGSANLFSSALNDVLQAGLLRHVAGGGLSFSQLKLLQLLELAKTQTIGEVAAFLGVSNAATSKMVDKLVQRGWLARTVGTADRRSAHISLTTRARRVLHDYELRRQQKLTGVFRRCSISELQRLARLMDHLTAAIVDHTAKPEQICLHCGIYFRGKCLVRDMGGHNCLYQQRAQARTGKTAR